MAAGAPRHPAGDAPRDPGDPRRGRRPHRDGDREGHAQDADRRRPEAARRGGAVRAGLRRPVRRSEPRTSAMEEIASVYARSLFEVAQEQDKLDDVREQLGEFADALDRDPRAAGVLLLALLLHAGEEGRAATRSSPARSRSSLNFLKLLIEKHRMPAVFRVRREFDELWQRENKLLPVEITSAIELDEKTVKQIGDRIGEQTGQKVELSAEVDPDILGGIVVRVGNSIIDASIRTRLEKLRKQVAKAIGAQCRSSPTRSPPSSRAASRASTRAAPTSPRSAPSSRSPTASRASTASRTARRSRCSSCPTT